LKGGVSLQNRERASESLDLERTRHGVYLRRIGRVAEGDDVTRSHQQFGRNQLSTVSVRLIGEKCKRARQQRGIGIRDGDSVRGEGRGSARPLKYVVRPANPPVVRTWSSDGELLGVSRERQRTQREDSGREHR